MTSRLAQITTAWPLRVLGVAAVLLALAIAFGLPVTGMMRSSRTDFQDPGSQYERANRAVQRASHRSPYYGMTILLSARRPLPGCLRELRALRRLGGLLARMPGFQGALSDASGTLPALLSRNRRSTLVLARFASAEASTAAADRLRALARSGRLRAQLGSMRARVGGPDLVFKELDSRTLTDLTHAELIAVPVILLLSLLIFRGLIAALLPVAVGGSAILLTLLALRLIDLVYPLSVFALNMTTGIGLGLGVDYSLFVLSRHREELAAGAGVPQALARALHTAGRTVLFSALTVATALTSLLLFPTRFLISMGIAGCLVALLAGAVALTLLPALLALLGQRINALAPPLLAARAPGRSAVLWRRLAQLVMRRPITVALVTGGVMLAAAAPALGLRLVAPGPGLLPAGAESRTVEEAIAARFEVNLSQATELVVHAGPPARGAAPQVVRLLSDEVARAAQGLALPLPPSYVGNGLWQLTLAPRGNPFSPAAERLVGSLRKLARPARALVGGAAAYFSDEQSAISARLGPALAALFALSALFLFLLTRSAILPIKAFAMSMLTAAAGIGLLVLIFQHGLLAGVLGLKVTGGLQESNLLLLLVIAYALSTDYEVFLLGRIKEAHDSGLANRSAVALGIERTGRLITAAAALFCVAVGALASAEVIVAKQFGLGAALAVALDASIVRALLVPALMALIGDLNWWAPHPQRWLRRARAHAPRRLTFRPPMSTD